MASSRALATRCPACGTVFRVVPDQLRVSEGWVRCGRCAEVFNAPESLVDMDTGARQRLPDADKKSLVATPATATDGAAPGVARHPLEGETPPSDAALPAHGPAPAEPPPPTPVDTDAIAPPGHAIDFGIGAPGPDADADAAAGPLPDPRAEPDDRPPPSFVRQADRAARWRRPRLRLALGVGAGVAALVLGAQVVFTYRDLAAARWPELRPALEQACAALNCELGAVRAIGGLAVQSSGLARVEASDLYRLSVTLRNQSDIDLATPAIDLSLTDTQGRLVSRRVLRLAELGHLPDSLAAGREVVLQTTLQVAATEATGPVAGYTIELFYP